MVLYSNLMDNTFLEEFQFYRKINQNGCFCSFCGCAKALEKALFCFPICAEVGMTNCTYVQNCILKIYYLLHRRGNKPEFNSKS